MATDQLGEMGEERASGRRLVRQMLLAAGGLIVAAIIGAFALIRFDLGWVGALVMTLLLLAGTVWLIRGASGRAQALGCASPAMLRYNRRMMVCSIAYMLAFFGATYAYKQLQVTGAALWAAALLPALAVWGMVWAMVRLVVEETDEYLRSRVIYQALFATAGLLGLGTFWGFLEQFALVPHIPAWAILPVFALLLGVGAAVQGRRA